MIAPIRSALRALLISAGVMLVCAIAVFRQILPNPMPVAHAEAHPQSGSSRAVDQQFAVADQTVPTSASQSQPDREHRDVFPQNTARANRSTRDDHVMQTVSSSPHERTARPGTDRQADVRETASNAATHATTGRSARPAVELLPELEHSLDVEEAPLQQRPPLGVVFRAVPQEEVARTIPTDRLEARLVGLERQLTQLAQAQEEKQSSKLDQTTQFLQHLQGMLQSKQLENLEQQVDLLRAGNPVSSGAGQEDPSAQTPPAVPVSPSGRTAPILQAERDPGNPEKFTMHFQDAEISEVLSMLGQLAGVNILVGKDIEGQVPAANLRNVTLDQALHSILRSLGYTFEREDEFIFVMTQSEAELRNRLKRKLVTKIYRPHYISVQDLEALIVPLQTKEVGQIARTTQAEVGLSTDAESAGGDHLAQRDALLVQDYPEVIQQIDQVLEEMDVPPLQVVIEAMILSVTLTDTMAYGVNFALLNGATDSLLLSGNGQRLAGSSGFPSSVSGGSSILPPGAEFLANTAGLKYGFLRGDISMFIEALETITDTNLIASPNIRVLNKQRANLIIGEQLAYTTTTQNGTSSIENVNFLEVGTRLVIRPFIAPDGLVRLELHPEQSSGTIDARNLPNKATTEVTTNVMVRDGTTVVVGGLIEERIVESQDRVPFFGAIPIVGNAFRTKRDRIERRELIVLITPRIVVEPDAEIEGDVAKYEHQNRTEQFRNRLSPINQRNLARMDYERALYFFQHGNYARAKRHIEMSLEENANDLNALRLKEEIDAAQRAQKRKWLKWPSLGGKPHGLPPEEIVYESEPVPVHQR